MKKGAYTDIDLVRWAHVRVLLESEEYQKARTKSAKEKVANRVIAELRSAAPEDLVILLMLSFDEIKLCERLAKALQSWDWDNNKPVTSKAKRLRISQ